MKLIEICFFAILVPVFAELFISSGKLITKFHADAIERSEKLNCDKFISSFPSSGDFLIDGKISEKEIKDWINVCNSLWKLESFSFEKKGTKGEKSLYEIKWCFRASERKKIVILEVK